MAAWVSTIVAKFRYKIREQFVDDPLKSLQKLLKEFISSKSLGSTNLQLY